MPLHIRLLGPVVVERGDAALPLPPSRKARALLAYLVATGRVHGREHLCELLWPGPADPRAALRGALSRLRPLLEGDGRVRLVSQRDLVSFDPCGAHVDVATVRRVAAHPEACELDALQHAVDCVRGESVEGLALPRCHGFDAWCTAERETARRARVAILTALVDRLSDRPGDALEFARRRLLLEPSAEAAHVDVIRLLALMGRSHAALRQYETCRRVLRTELGIGPSRELEAVRLSIGRPSRTVSAPQQRVPRRAPELPAVVGRREELRMLRDGIAAARGGHRQPAVMFVGEAGIGKTRLLGEATGLAREVGGEALVGRSFEAETVRPYGTWVDALRAIPLGEVPMDLRPELSPILPEFGATAIDAPDRTRFFDAVVQLFASRLDIHVPLVLLLDDVQWIDEASAALLHYVARTAPARVLLVCAARVAELEDNAPAARLVRGLMRGGELRRVDLAALDADDTAQLVRDVSPGLDVGRVYEESEGNPLFAIEIARAGHGAAGAVPATVEGLIEERLAKLSRAASGLVPWAAALRRDLRLDTLESATEMPATALLAVIEELERRDVLKPVHGGYDFTHDLVRHVAYGRISEPRRRLIHARIAHALAGDAAGSGGLDGEIDGELAADVAHHAIHAGEAELAARACLAAGRRALWMFAPGEAAELAALGMAQLERLAPEIRLRLHVELLAFSVYPGMQDHRIPHVERELSRVLREARAAGLKAEVHRGFQLISYAHLLSGDFSGALDRSLLAQEVGREADPVTVVRAIGDTARCLGILERDMPRAERLAREAHSLAQGIDYEGHELSQALGHVHHHAGRWEEAVASFERAAYLARNERERWFECIDLARLVMIELERGCPANALARCPELLSVTTQLGEGSDAPFADALEGLARVLAEGHEEGLQAGGPASVDQALARLRHLDSRWMIAYVQNSAAAIELDAGRPVAARRRIDEALHAAELVGRRNEVVVARALLADLALRRGEVDEARHQLAAVRPDLEHAGALSCRARTVLTTASDALTAA